LNTLSFIIIALILIAYFSTTYSKLLALSERKSNMLGSLPAFLPASLPDPAPEAEAARRSRNRHARLVAHGHDGAREFTSDVSLAAPSHAATKSRTLEALPILRPPRQHQDGSPCARMRERVDKAIHSNAPRVDGIGLGAPAPGPPVRMGASQTRAAEPAPHRLRGRFSASTRNDRLSSAQVLRRHAVADERSRPSR